MGRPKGYAAWNASPASLAVVRDVRSVLDEYRDHLPLTVRQIFYRLVGQYGYEKTERAYSRLAEYLVRARRAQMIPFSAIRDDGTVGQGGGGWASVQEYLEDVVDGARYYKRDRLDGQPFAVELWCEAAGMVPQLERVARQYSIPVYSTGGFSSVTVTHEIAGRALRQERPTAFLHVGDFDPSGESIFEAMGTDAKSFLRGALLDDGRGGEDAAYLGRDLPDDVPDLRLRRVALTADQVEEHGLPTAPPKSSDTRSVNWVGATCQAEAMAPDLLAEIVEGALRETLDLDVYRGLLETEREERDELVARLDAIEL